MGNLLRKGLQKAKACASSPGASGGQPQSGGEQGASPQGHRAGPQLEEELVKAEETQGPIGCTDGEDAEREKEVSMPVV